MKNDVTEKANELKEKAEKLEEQVEKIVNERMENIVTIPLIAHERDSERLALVIKNLIKALGISVIVNILIVIGFLLFMNQYEVVGSDYSQEIENSETANIFDGIHVGTSEK